MSNDRVEPSAHGGGRRAMTETLHPLDRTLAGLPEGLADEQPETYDAIIRIGVSTLGTVEQIGSLSAATMADQRDRLPLDTAVQILAALQDARKELQQVEALIEQRIIHLWRAENMRQPHPVEGAGVLEVRRSRDRKAWDTHGMVSAVIDANLEATGGEVPDPWTVRDWITAACHIDYGRVGILKALHLRPGDYCTEEPGRDTVSLTRP